MHKMHQSRFRTAQNLPTAISTPFSLIPTQQIPLPDPIIESINMQTSNATLQHKQKPEIISELSERNRVAFIAIGKKLFVWDYSNQSKPLPHAASQQNMQLLNHYNIGTHEAAQTITAIKEITCVNLKSSICKFSVEDSILLLVSTLTEIQLLIISKG